MKARALWIAFGVGLGLQLAMVITGHFVPVVKNSGFAIGGMAISLFAGFLYANSQKPDGVTALPVALFRAVLAHCSASQCPFS
jgi:hypothetical protein